MEALRAQVTDEIAQIEAVYGRGRQAYNQGEDSTTDDDDDSDESDDYDDSDGSDSVGILGGGGDIFGNMGIDVNKSSPSNRRLQRSRVETFGGTSVWELSQMAVVPLEKWTESSWGQGFKMGRALPQR